MDFSNEVWKPIKGFEYYEVSNLGRVRSISHVDSMGRMKAGKILKQGFDGKNNYLHVGLGKGGAKRYSKNVHRLVACAFIPNPHGFKEVNHKDENKINNSVDNLEWCNHKYNSNYGSRAGLFHGEKNPQSKIGYNCISFIRKNHKSCGGEYRNCDLAKMFNISEAHVSSIAHRRRWNYDDTV